MTQNKLFYLFLVALEIFSANITVSAQNIEQIYMKSGSVVEGYIAEQNPGKHLIIQDTKATIVANTHTLKYKIT